MPHVDPDAVAALTRETAATCIVPRFQTLSSGDIDEKAPGETVTVADREAEAFLTAHLRRLLPGVPVVGEEAVADDPDLVHAIASEPMAWLVDPLDGTANFAAGQPYWAVMIALVAHGDTVQSWLYQPAEDRMYIAERGSGAWRDGARLRCPAAPVPRAELRGAILQRFLTEDERSRMEPCFRRFGEILPGLQCSGYEYPAIIEGRQHFALFQRLLPWDHVPGALLLTEAGGVARRTDGTNYAPSPDGRGLLLADAPETWRAVHETLYGTRVPGSG